MIGDPVPYAINVRTVHPTEFRSSPCVFIIKRGFYEDKSRSFMRMEMHWRRRISLIASGSRAHRIVLHGRRGITFVGIRDIGSMSIRIIGGLRRRVL